MAFADAFDMEFSLEHDFETMRKVPIFLNMTTDSKSLFDVIARTSITTGKRLKIDLQNAKDVYAPFEVNDVALMRSEYNIANALTMAERKCVLFDTISNEKLDHAIEQWLICTKADKASVDKEK